MSGRDFSSDWVIHPVIPVEILNVPALPRQILRPAAPPPSNPPDRNVDVALERLEKLQTESKNKTPMEVMVEIGRILTDLAVFRPASQTSPRQESLAQTEIQAPTTPIETKSTPGVKETWVLPVPVSKWEDVYMWAACRCPPSGTESLRVPRTIHFDLIEQSEFVELGKDDFRLRIDVTKKIDRWHGITFPCPVKDIHIFGISKEGIKSRSSLILSENKDRAFSSTPIDLNGLALEIHWSVDTEVYRIHPGPGTQMMFRVTNSYSADFFPH